MRRPLLHRIVPIAVLVTLTACSRTEPAAPETASAPSSTPSAQAPPSAPTPLHDAKDAFRAADANSDGKVTLEEYRNRSMAVFGELDINGDGKVAGTEHAKATHDVDAKAFNAALHKYFARADLNRDGALDADEWAKVPVPDSAPSAS